MADLENTGLVNWDSKSGTFDLYELLHLTEIDV